jgi:hypothetical protein
MLSVPGREHTHEDVVDCCDESRLGGIEPGPARATALSA